MEETLNQKKEHVIDEIDKVVKKILAPVVFVGVVGLALVGGLFIPK